MGTRDRDFGHRKKRRLADDDSEDEEGGRFVPLRRSVTGMLGDSKTEDNLVVPHVADYVPRGESARDAELLRAAHQIHIDVDENASASAARRRAPPPLDSFSDALNARTVQALAARGISTPTTIQRQVIPCVLQGRDVIANAETGSGKTLAFVLPAMTILRNSLGRGPPPPPSGGSFVRSLPRPLVLVLAPTRELADQLHHELCWAMPLVGDCGAGVATTTGTLQPCRAVLVTGGMSLADQIAELQRGADVVVATPGRLVDLLDRAALALDEVVFLVFDECDRLIEAGVEKQLRLILRACKPEGRQTTLFSATLPQSLRRLARSAVLDPVWIRVGRRVGELPRSLRHTLLHVEPEDKRTQILSTLRATPQPPVLVFCNKIETVDTVVRWLRSEQFHAAGLHSEKKQDTRFAVASYFRDGACDVLVSTDVGSRGLDFSVSHVVMFDMPDTLEDYVHRAGRTGRCGREGLVTSFVSRDIAYSQDLVQLLQRAKQRVPSFLYMKRRRKVPPSSKNIEENLH